MSRALIVAADAQPASAAWTIANTMEPVTAWMARATIIYLSVGARPMSSEARENTTRPAAPAAPAPRSSALGGSLDQ